MMLIRKLLKVQFVDLINGQITIGHMIHSIQKNILLKGIKSMVILTRFSKMVKCMLKILLDGLFRLMDQSKIFLLMPLLIELIVNLTKIAQVKAHAPQKILKNLISMFNDKYY